jgi:putative ABC transport system permease protein
VRWLSAVARLRPGVTLARADADTRAVARHLAEEYPDANASYASAAAVPLRDAIVGDVRRALLVLLASVVVIVLIACVNVANLLLVRATARRREFAVRAALGGTRARLACQVLTESLVLALGGGLLGIGLAWWGQGILVRLSGDHLPRAADVHVDGMVLGFAFLLSALTGAAFGLLPALRLGGPLSGALRESGRSGSAAAGTLRLRNALVVLEVALAITLVAGAGLMVKSFARLVRVDPGFDAEHTLLANFMLPLVDDSTPSLMNARVREIVDAVRAVPGIVAASEIKEAPLRGEGEPAPFAIPGRPAPRRGEEPTAETLPVGPGYFATMRIPLLAGRDFLPSDTTAGAPRLVVNQAFARRWFRGEPVVGKRVRLLGADFEVIGEAGDVRTLRLDSLAHPTIYVPRQYMSRAVVALVARAQGDPAAVMGAVRTAIHSVAPNLPIGEIVPMRQVLSDAVAVPRFLTVLISLFGVLALVLAVVGLYGVVAFIVGQRANEIGIRMALGARANEVVWLMLRRGMGPVLVGAVVGLGIAVLATRLMRSLLFEVSATDPATFAAITLILLAAAFVAALVPARRAARIDPMETLRHE